MSTIDRHAAGRRCALALAALAVAALAAGGTASPAAAAPKCAKSGKEIKRNKHVRVYRKGKSGGDLGSPNYYACHLKMGKLTKLNPPADFGGGEPLVKTLDLAGARVAFAAVIPTGCCMELELDIIDATKKHKRRVFDAGLQIDNDVSILKIALASNGDVGWIADGCAVNAAGTDCIGDDSAPPPPNELQVWARGHTHAVGSLLAHGHGIVPGSIGITSAFVRWSDGGVATQAPIP